MNNRSSSNNKTTIIHSSIILILCFLVSSTTCSRVVNLTSQTFSSTIQSHKYVMVKFYTPWCGHCKTMVPEYEKLAEIVKDTGVVIGEIDATIEKQITEKYEINGFPTVKLFVDGLVLDYNGPRTASEMYEWVKKVIQTELKYITESEINTLKQTQHLVVYYGTNQTILTILKLLSTTDNTTSYFLSTQQHQQSPLQTNLLLFSPRHPSPIQFNHSEPLTLQSIKQWILINTIDDVVPLKTKQHLEYVFYDKKSVKDVAMLLKESDLAEEDQQKFRQICASSKHIMKCCIVDKEMQIYSGVKSYLRSRGKTVLALTRDTLKQAYPYPYPLSSLTNQSWSQFIQQVTQSRHKNIASGENDQINYQYVKILTSENYTSFINQHDVVLVEYVSPGCAKCAEFAEVYEQLAMDVYENKEVEFEVTAIDMRKNMEVAAKLQTMDFPSFRLYLAGADVQYKGGRDRAELLKFINTTMNIKPIQVHSITDIPTPSVILYDPSSTSHLRHLPAIFTRYPVYHLKQGTETKIVVKHNNNQEKTFPSGNFILNVSSVAKWLHKETEPVLVDMLMTTVDGKLREALSNQIHLLGLIDVEQDLSASLRSTLEQYCKKHTDIVCGYAKKGENHFEELMAWVGIDKNIITSQIIYVNTTSFEKFIFTQKIQELNVQHLEQFVSDVQEGKAKKIEQPQELTNKKQVSEQAKDSSNSDQL